MKFLLDTCVISEPKQKRPNAEVLRWLNRQNETKIYLSALTVGEINKGIGRLPTGEKKLDLTKWLEELCQRFSGRILSLDIDVFMTWGKMLGEFENEGVVRPAFDSLLEATAWHHRMTFVTRNVKNFQNSPTVIFNPWEI